MSDITEREKLERAAHFLREEGFGQEAASVEEAADEIERLRAAIRAALDAPMIDEGDRRRSTYGILEAALRGQG